MKIKLLLLLLSPLLISANFQNGGLVLDEESLRLIDILVQRTDDTPMTYYVRSAGSDSNNCKSELTACATVQHVVDTLPTYIKNTVTIDVGEGSFAGFTLSGHTIENSSSLVIDGVYGTPVLSSGTDSGTSSGGDNDTLIDATQSWIDTELEGMVLYVNNVYLPIYGNDATTIETGYSSTTLSGKPYVIYDLTTVFNSGGTAAARIEITGNSVIDKNSIKLQKIKISGAGKAYSFRTTYQGGFTLSNVTATGASQSQVYIASAADDTYLSNMYTSGGKRGYYLSQCTGNIGTNNMTATSHTEFGAYITNNLLVLLGSFYGSACTTGIFVSNTYSVLLTRGSISGGTTGILLDNNKKVYSSSWLYRGANSFLRITGPLNISGNTDGIVIDSKSMLMMDDVDGNNNLHGLWAYDCSYIVFTTNTGLSGTTADVRMNESANYLDFTTDFTSDLDRAVNSDTGCVIQRNDKT